MNNKIETALLVYAIYSLIKGVCQILMLIGSAVLYCAVFIFTIVCDVVIFRRHKK